LLSYDSKKLNLHNLWLIRCYRKTCSIFNIQFHDKNILSMGYYRVFYGVKLPIFFISIQYICNLFLLKASIKFFFKKKCKNFWFFVSILIKGFFLVNTKGNFYSEHFVALLSKRSPWRDAHGWASLCSERLGILK